MEIKKLQRELERRADWGRAASKEGGKIDQAIGEFVARVTSPDPDYADLSSEQLRRRIDFLEEHFREPQTSAHEQQFKEKKSRRYMDARDELFEELEVPFTKDIEAKKLHRELRLRVLNDKSLTSEERDELLQQLERRFGKKMKEAGFVIFEDD